MSQTYVFFRSFQIKRPQPEAEAVELNISLRSALVDKIPHQNIIDK